MAPARRIVIVGTGLAGGTAAGELRERGFDGEITLVGHSPHRPYALPPLSKAVLLGEAEEPDWVHEEKFYADKDIDLRTGTDIRELHLGERAVVDGEGTRIPYDRLVLATGATPRALPVPGGDLHGLHTLRTWEDSLTLRATLAPGVRVVIVGAGWIGCEVAAAARKHGAEVTVVDPLPLPLHKTLGDTVAEMFRDLHAANGVTWHLGIGVDAFTGDEGVVRSVHLSDGVTLPADVVVVGVGAAPRLELAKGAGLELSDSVPGSGVDVDATLRTSAPDVYAIGDIAAHFHPRYGRRVRVEHWANAKDQGSHVAGNLLGAAEPYTASPYFFSDQYDLGMEVRGLANPFTDDLVVRGDLAAREFTAFWTRGGRVLAAMNVNQWDDGDALQALVDQRGEVSADDLRTKPLADLI
ncbi:NAD(P)/FAD-dependent oxidoreductase [Actinokineospora xionganensis]|uniref:NAD(P)/FAD-dependent oxidoreductase n=1 Tax=Actinokineospora xionganensis TaxID=2684470 RepID=A0ABR7L5L1_9PSEU|nr:FAD/NAD(P)-binding oxidoreductase [Actinokineospora xionganensis]MBC6447958.1 NAD(P)/FAD-dependent oxidoreductase [Actinokineospora xionganensis]